MSIKDSEALDNDIVVEELLVRDDVERVALAFLAAFAEKDDRWSRSKQHSDWLHCSSAARSNILFSFHQTLATSIAATSLLSSILSPDLIILTNVLIRVATLKSKCHLADAGL